MTRKERIAALCTGIILFCVAAVFSIGLFLGILDFGTAPYKSSIVRLGEMIVSVYGFCSVLIPAFFFAAGAFCLSAKWSIQRAFILLISVVPFFTLVVAERTCMAIAAQDASPVAVVKIITLLAIAFLLVALEYLLAVTAATYLEKTLSGGKTVSPKKIKSLLTQKISAVAAFKQKKRIQDAPKTESEPEPSEPEHKEKEPEPESTPEKTELAEPEEAEFEIPVKKVQGVWSIDSEGNVKGTVSAPEITESAEETEEEPVPAEEIELAEEPDEPDDLLDETDEDIIDQFEKKSMSLTEELAQQENADETQPMLPEKTAGDSVPYEIAFEEPEYEDQTEQSLELEETEETVLQEPENSEPSSEEQDEEFFSFSEDQEEPDIQDSLDETISEEPEELNEYAEEEPEPEPYSEQESFQTEYPAVQENPRLAKDSGLETVFSRMEEDARAQVEKTEIQPSASNAIVTSEDGTERSIPIPPKKKKSGPYKIATDLLTAYDENKYWIIDSETEQAANSLKATLSEFKIDAEVTGIRKGPVVTMFEILPAPGVKLSRIVALSDNIALRLAASSVRIVAPIPGKKAVGIEVPNRNRAIVSFRECIEQQRSEWKKMAVPAVLGKDIQGETQIMDLVKTPHLLIAGSTGAGKSVCVNSMILSILYKRSPHEVKMILIDPKIVELKLYNGIPHLLTPVITEPKKAMQALQYCLCEMERRYAVLDSMGCRDISNYNKKISEQHIATEKLPYLIVIIDEFADLMATTGKALEGVVARLAAMSRAVGIHLVLATQRPSVDVITGLIKANIPSRIAFMVAAKMDSRIIIDQVGAEKLLGKGDMLYASATDPFPVRIQGAFVSDQEVENVVEEVKKWGEPEYIDDEIFIDDEDGENPDQLSLFNEGGEDPLYEKALDIVIQAGKASASYIQRRLSIGYNRAARLVEEMEERGIVGPANGSKPREIIHMP